jgi:hypothetical protein
LGVQGASGGSATKDKDEVQATRGLATKDWGRRAQGPKAQVDEMLYLSEGSLFIYSCITLYPAWKLSHTSVWGFGLLGFVRECSCARPIGMSGDQSRLLGCSTFYLNGLVKLFPGVDDICVAQNLNQPPIRVETLQHVLHSFFSKAGAKDFAWRV